jgi:hypothetical protein
MSMNSVRRIQLPLLLSAAVLFVLVAGPVLAANLVEAKFSAASIELAPLSNHGGVELRIASPDGKVVSRSFGANEAISISLFDAKGQTLADGAYNWEAVLAPAAGSARLGAAATRGDSPTRGIGSVDSGRVASGSFRVHAGAFVMPDEIEGAPARVASRVASGARSADAVRVAAADQVIPDDLIVQGSACVGLDCVNNENFGFDTIRMKENNTRIDFTDTSVGTFPSQDWEIAANDSASGGRNAFIVSDENTQLFVIESSNLSNALYIDDAARVGLRTSAPVLDLHISTSNTPGIRLEQTNAGGFTAQTWDIAGNEANFFVRSVTTGSQLPFRIRPGAPSSSIDISADGDVGIGTASPDNPLHVFESSASFVAALNLENEGGDVGFRLTNDVGGMDLNLVDNAGVQEFRINIGASPQEFTLTQTGNVTITGQLVTGGPQCGVGSPCDGVFSSDYEVESIEEHAALMWANSYLPAVGPTAPGAPMNVSEKTGRILNELEKAHIYIEQLHGSLLQSREEVLSLALQNRQIQEEQTRLARKLEELGERMEIASSVDQ